MDHWKRSTAKRAAAWERLDKVIDADVALLQEAAPPPERTAVYRRGGIDRHRPWGSAVVTKRLEIDEITQATATGRTFELLNHYPGCVAIARVQPDGVEPITFVSLYGQLDKGWAITTVNNLISDLSPLFVSKLGHRLVLGGDLNLSTQLSRPWRYFSRNLFERIKLFGLESLTEQVSAEQRVADCPCEDDPCLHVQTHRHPSSSKPWQNDYLFASKQLAKRLTRCAASEAGDPPWVLSDHRPLIAEFDL